MSQESLTQRLKRLRRQAVRAKKEEEKMKVLVELLGVLMEWEGEKE